MVRGKLGLAALGLAVIAAVAVAVFYVRYALPEYKNANATLTETENALAMADTLLLASIDLDFLRKLETKLYGKAELPDLTPEATPNDSVMTDLQRALMLHPDSLSYISAAVYAGKDRPLLLAVVAGGDIQTDEVINALRSSAQVAAHPQIANAWSVQKQDLNTCQISSPITVIASKGRIIALNGDDPALIERLQRAAPAARDLARWLDFRASRFFAAAVFVPDELSAQSLGPFVGNAAAQAKQKLTDFDAIYLGAASKSFPPGGSLALWMSAHSPEIAADKAAVWQAALVASRKDWEKTLPTMAALHDRATISARDNLLQTEVRLDKKLAAETRKLPGELLGLVFSGFAVQANAPKTASDAAAEEIDKTPRKFADQVDLAQIPPYDPKALFAEPADVVAGPLGLQVAGVRLTDTDPRLVEIEIKATASNLPNVGDSADSAMDLSISSVRDKDGKELLREEPCGRDRNSLAAHPSFSFGNGVLSATKKVRLLDSVHHADIASILGNVRLNVPTRIEAVAVINPKIGDHIEREGLRIEVTKAEPNSVSYRVSGKTERLLHLRAKNDKGEYLTSGGLSSMGSPFGKSTTLEIKGKIASLEFILAQAVEPKDFPFELKGAHPQAKDGWTLDKPPAYEAYKRADIKRDYTRQVTAPKRYQSPLASGKAGPGIVDLNQVSTFRDVRLSFSPYLPLLKNLDGALSAAEFEIQKLTFADGSIHQSAEGQPAWRASVSLSRSGNDDYVSGRAEVETGITGKSAQLSSVSGRLWLNVPLAFERSALPVTDVGTQLTTYCGPMRITEIAQNGVKLEGNGDPACLFAVRALNAEGKDLRINNTSLIRQPPTWRLQMSMNAMPNSFELIMVKKSERLNYPFTLTVGDKAE